MRDVKCVFCGTNFKLIAKFNAEPVCDTCKKEIETEMFVELSLNPEKFNERLKFLDENLLEQVCGGKKTVSA